MLESESQHTHVLNRVSTDLIQCMLFGLIVRGARALHYVVARHGKRTSSAVFQRLIVVCHRGVLTGGTPCDSLEHCICTQIWRYTGQRFRNRYWYTLQPRGGRENTASRATEDSVHMCAARSAARVSPRLMAPLSHSIHQRKLSNPSVQRGRGLKKQTHGWIQHASKNRSMAAEVKGLE